MTRTLSGGQTTACWCTARRGRPGSSGETLPRLKGGGIKTKPVAKIIASSRSVSRQEMGGETGEVGDWDEVNIVTHPSLVLIRFYIAEDR